MNKFEVGADISSILEVEELGGKYFDYNNNEVDLFKILKDNGFTSIRLRLWLNPYDSNGNPYLAGTCDLPRVIKMARRTIENNMNIMLDLHYSDFWVDPAKQTLPKEWENISDVNELANKVYEYTKEVLEVFKKENLPITYIQIGNEITNGMLWPYAKIYKNNRVLQGKFKNLALFLKSGVRAVKEISPKTKTIIHLERSGFTEIYGNYLTLLNKYKVEYDILGMSYYPYWHKDLNNLENTLKLVKEKFNKEMMLVEYSFAYSEEIVTNDDGTLAPFVIRKDKDKAITTPISYPISVEGQIKFFTDLYNLLKKYDVLGFYYWEPGWLNVKGTSWASPEAMKYINEFKDFGNEWANEGLFDLDGHPLDSLKIFNYFGGSSHE